MKEGNRRFVAGEMIHPDQTADRRREVARGEVPLMFSEQEIAYLKTQRLARVATVSRESQPDVAPVAFECDGEQFYIGGLNITKTLKYKNVQDNKRVALVVDDLETADPWKPRGIKLHGRAEIVERAGRFGSGTYLRIIPEVHWSWGIEGPVFKEGKALIKKTRW